MIKRIKDFGMYDEYFFSSMKRAGIMFSCKFSNMVMKEEGQ
jgi:hypothetical protein